MRDEQLLADLNAQLSNVSELFATDEKVGQTYFNYFFDPSSTGPEVNDFPALVNGEYTALAMRDLSETAADFADRRNRFLDHLLARFGEQFTDYALLLRANADRLPFEL
ncbi:MAG: diguanylate cyclase, partial [Cytophagales bacterium]|nr:diguanylate cyclase [Cytophagales bacterium]